MLSIGDAEVKQDVERKKQQVRWGEEPPLGEGSGSWEEEARTLSRLAKASSYTKCYPDSFLEEKCDAYERTSCRFVWNVREQKEYGKENPRGYRWSEANANGQAKRRGEGH